MIQRPIFRTIKIAGLSRYEVSETGEVRIVATKVKRPVILDEDGNRFVYLNHREKKKAFMVDELMFKTFKTIKKPFNDDEIPDISVSTKDKQFSENEDDYGKGSNATYWQEIKEHLELVRKIENNEGSNLE